jgi:hypothetical protein
MIYIKLKDTEKLEDILNLLKDADYELTTKKSWKTRILEFFGIYGKEEHKQMSFEEIVTDEYVKNHPHDNRYRNLPLENYARLKEKTFSNYPDVFNWEQISNLNLTTEFMIENFNRLNRKKISSKKLPTSFMVKKYEELDIELMLRNNDIPGVYIELYEKSKKEKLTEEEGNFIRYLNVWNIVFHYSKKLEEMNKKEVSDKLIYGWFNSFSESEVEEELNKN